MINVKNKCKKTPSTIVTTDEMILTEPKAISNAMNNFFASIGKKMADTIPEVHSSVPTPTPAVSMKNSLFLQPTTSDEVETHINGLNNNKAIRTIDVETKFIKLRRNILSPVLSDLFNACIAQDEFRDCLKIAEVIPIFKKGDHNVATNYRPISFLSLIDKIFEKLDYIRVSSYHKKYKLLSKNQFGFREFRTAYLLLICRFEVAWRMEHSRYFFLANGSCRFMHTAAYMLMQRLYAYATTTLSHYCHLPNLMFQPYLPNQIHRSETKPRREPNPKLVQRFLQGAAAALSDTASQRSRCDEANNGYGAYEPTLGPFAFAREKNTAGVPFAKSLLFRFFESVRYR